nr:hypothetical protein [Desulfurococcales archaeon]
DGSELVYVGSRLPFFLYPEAFNVGAIASTVFENLVSWLSEVEEDPGPVLAAAEKIRTADSVEEKSSIANGFADMVFSERILASYTYLGGRCVLDGDSLGAETSCSLGFNFSLPKRILSFSAERFSSLLGSNVTLESLEEALKGAVVMEAIPPGFIHEPVIRLPRLVGVGGLHEPNYEILVPLPSGNPFNASMLYLYSSYGKLYPCGPLEEAGREHALSYLERRRGVSSLEGYTVKILSDNTIEIVEESTGRSTEIRVPTDLNGTDGARYLGDEAIARLQRLAENAWAASGPLLEDYMSRAYEVVLNLVTVTAARGFDEALSEARSRVDMLAREYSQLLELARSWPNISVVTGTPAAPGGDGVESGVVGVANVTEAEAPQEGLVTGAPVLGGEAQGSRAILYLLLLVPVAGSVVLLLLMLRRRW